MKARLKVFDINGEKEGEDKDRVATWIREVWEEEGSWVKEEGRAI